MSNLPWADGRLAFVGRSAELRRVLALGFTLGLAYSFVIPFLSLFGTQEVGMSPLRFAVFMTATSVAAILSSTWLSRWSDVALSRRTTLLIGSAGGTLGYLAYAVLRDFQSLVLAGCTILALSSVTFSQVFAVARESCERGGVSKKEMPLYINLVRLTFAAAWTIGPAISSWILSVASYFGAFLAASGLYALFGGLVWFTLRDAPPHAEARAIARALPLRRALLQPVVLVHFVSFCIYHACATMGMMNLPLFITQELFGTRQQVGIAYGIAPVFEIPFMLYVGVLGARVQHARIIRVSLIAAILYFAGLSVCGAPRTIYALQILGAGIVAVMTGLAITFFQDFMPGQPGTATNLYSSSNRVGSTLGYLCFGLIAQTWNYRAVFVACACAILFAWALLVATRRWLHVVPGDVAVS